MIYAILGRQSSASAEEPEGEDKHQANSKCSTTHLDYELDSTGNKPDDRKPIKRNRFSSAEFLHLFHPLIVISAFRWSPVWIWLKTLNKYLLFSKKSVLQICISTQFYLRANATVNQIESLNNYVISNLGTDL